MKKRILSSILAASIAGTLLVGCGNKSTDESTKKTDEAKTEETTKEETKEEENKPVEKVTLTYANWNLGNKDADTLERRMVQAWNDTNPNIQVQIDETMDYSKYGDSLTAAAAAGTMPDVIMLQNIPSPLASEWLADISAYTSKDSEWNKIPKPLEQATHYGKGVYAVPTGMYFEGYFVNDDIFQNANADSLNFSPTMDEFWNAVKATANPSQDILGISESLQIPDWYPSAVNKSLGWFTFDGSKYNLDSQEYKDAINKAREVLNNKYSFDALTQEQKDKLKAGWHGDMWNQGKVAIRWDGTWSTKDFSAQTFKNRFIGVPGGRTIIVPDFLAVTKSSKSTEAAYEFAKFLSFSKDGILKRMELGAKDNSFSSLPITTDQEVLDKYFATFTYEGIKEAYGTIDNGVVEAVKVVPGYVASRWTAQTGIKVGDKDNATIGETIDGSLQGKVKIEDVAGQLNKLANDEYNNAVKATKALTE